MKRKDDVGRSWARLADGRVVEAIRGDFPALQVLAFNLVIEREQVLVDVMDERP